MSVNPGLDAPLEPLPAHVQDRVWWFVRHQIQQHEARIGTKVAEFEIHVTDTGQIEVAVLATESEKSAAIDDGLEDAGLKDEVHRTAQRENLLEDGPELPK